MRRIALVGLVLVLGVAATGCRQAGSAWQGARNCAAGAFSKPCKLDCSRPGDTRPSVPTDPVYDSWCASDARVGGPSYRNP